MMILITILIGFLLGAILNHSSVTSPTEQISALRLEDLSVFKFGFCAICTAVVCTHLLIDTGLITPPTLPPLILGRAVIGGACIGIGWAVSGYYPSVLSAALGEGRSDALWCIVGCSLGMIGYTYTHLYLQKAVSWGVYDGMTTLPAMLEVSPWWCIMALVVAFIWCCVWLERYEL